MNIIKKNNETEGEVVEVKNQQDSLKVEGGFVFPPAPQLPIGGRSPALRRPDNLVVEGSFQGRVREEWVPGKP